jgi:hypothetical protein
MRYAYEMLFWIKKPEADVTNEEMNVIVACHAGGAIHPFQYHWKILLGDNARA